MNSLVTVKIQGKDVKRFLQNLYKKGFHFYHLAYSKNSIEATMSYQDYLKLKEIKTIYEIYIIKTQGWIHLKELFSTYKIFFASILFGICLLYFLSNIIFSVEVVHDKQKIRDFLVEQLKNRGIKKYAFVKSFDQGEKIVQDILTTYRDQLEWLEIERVGTKYIVRVEERKLLDIDDDETPRDCIAKKRGVILSISASTGEVVKKVNDYVKPGDVLISGTIKNKDTIKSYVHAKGQIFAEVWYQVHVEVPYFYQEKRTTGNKKKNLAFHFLSHEIRTFPSFSTKNDRSIFTLSDFLLPISITYLEEKETIEEEILYSYDKALIKAREAAREKLLQTLGKEDEIIYEKSLKNYEEDSKIIVDMFFKTKEDITSYIGINTQPLEEEKKEE